MIFRNEKNRNQNKSHITTIKTMVSVIVIMTMLINLTYVKAKTNRKKYWNKISTASAGTIIDKSDIDFKHLSKYFVSSKITKSVYKRIKGKSFDPNGKAKKSDLRYIKVLHYNYKHQIQVGELIVNKSIAKDIRAIFKKLFQKGYEIKSMYLIDKYWTGNAAATDKKSCEKGNTSAFCYRTITGSGKKLSNHALGLAIDINTRENPYVYKKHGKWICNYKNSIKYVNRKKKRKHMISHNDYCYKLFQSYGFRWGGDWKNIKDYQHFEIDTKD